MMAMWIFRFSCTIVASSHIVIWNPPSPTITQTSESRQATLAPMAAGSAKPMVPNPPDFAQRHLKSASADNRPNLGVGASDFGADGGGQRETHGAQSAGSNQR